jgi:hypothetical protein
MGGYAIGLDAYPGGGASTAINFYVDAVFREAISLSWPVAVQGGITPPPSDGGEYVYATGSWRLKSRSYVVDGLVSQVIPVPVGARMVRLMGSVFPSSGNGVTLRFAVSGTAMITSNYSWGGASFNTGTDQTLIYGESTGSSAMFITGTANMGNFPHTFTAEMNLVRVNTSKTFSLKSHGTGHSDLPNRLLRTALFNNWLPAGDTTALSITAIEVMGGTSFGTGSLVEVSWGY